VAQGGAEPAQRLHPSRRTGMTHLGPVTGDDGHVLDQIRLVGLEARGYHGVHEHEKQEGQTFRADVTVHLDNRAAARSDDVADALDYSVLAERVMSVVTGNPADLVETVAERIAAVVLTWPAVHTVDVAVHKPHAPMLLAFEDVVVTVRRDRWHVPVVGADDHLAERRVEPQPDEPVEVPALEPLTGGEPVVAAPVRVGERPEGPVEVVLALGSNIGDSQDVLRSAVGALASVPGVEVHEVSPLARTVAVGGPAGQPDFLNAVVLARTTLAPRELLHTVQGIEERHGRVRAERWGPRTLDIDIIQFGSVLEVTDDLELPHPRAHERAFVLQPWAAV